MTIVDLIHSVGAIFAVIPAIDTYAESGLLAAVGMYVLLIFLMGIITTVLQLVLSPLFDRKE